MRRYFQSLTSVFAICSRDLEISQWYQRKVTYCSKKGQRRFELNISCTRAQRPACSFAIRNQLELKFVAISGHRILRQNGIWWNGTRQVSVILLQLYFLGEWNEPARFLTVLLIRGVVLYTILHCAYILQSLQLLAVCSWLYIATS